MPPQSPREGHPARPARHPFFSGVAVDAKWHEECTEAVKPNRAHTSRSSTHDGITPLPYRLGTCT